MAKALDGLLILDFTSRLPGPLAGHMLQELGAQVIKIESATHPDPFKSLKLAKNDIAFQSWYHNINKDKDHFTFNSEGDDSLESLHALCKKAHMVLMGWPKKIQDMYALDFDSFVQRSNWGCFVELSASQDHNRPMHDLNVLAEKGYLSLHIKQWEHNHKAKRIAPPFLPLAGASFASMITQKVLAGALKGIKDQTWEYQQVSLEEAIDLNWGTLYAQDLRGIQDSFLHSGRYPCYNIYPLKNHRAFLAIACIEEKFWNEFTEAFELDIPSELRFSEQEEEVFEKIQTKIAQFDIEEMSKKLETLNCCLSLITME